MILKKLEDRRPPPDRNQSAREDGRKDTRRTTQGTRGKEEKLEGLSVRTLPILFYRACIKAGRLFQ